MKTTFISDISKKEFPISEQISARAIRHLLLEFIQKSTPTFDTNSVLAISELNYYKGKYISDHLIKEFGELSSLENEVIDSINNRSILSDDDNLEEKFTLGQKVADKVATFGGSWTFILSFGGFIFIWICINAFLLVTKAFDPYPFILLNLILSCLAALQAPVIMMSQNRQEEKDRQRAKQDYMINLKSELEIRILHEKIDHLMMHQQQELLELQKTQIEMMNTILKNTEINK
jgi:uncharacterized membrane protein